MIPNHLFGEPRLDSLIVNGTLKIIPFVPYQQNYIDNTPDLIQKSPRRLGYTDGTGIIKTFVFDTAGMVIEGKALKRIQQLFYGIELVLLVIGLILSIH